ncbi:MAG: hypothetical protein V1743_04680, partial [Nanoarchaeota archaeon]
MPTRKGQTWSIDYTIGLLLFLFAIVIGLKIIFNTFQDPTYEYLGKNAYTLMDQFTSEGYPYSWTKDDVLRIGLTTKNTVNITKLNTLYGMDPQATRKYLPTRNTYYLFLEDKDFGIIYYNATCGYGTTDITNNGTLTYHAVAYYTSQATEANLLPLASSTYA